jgi:hypothetical protein
MENKVSDTWPLLEAAGNRITDEQIRKRRDCSGRVIVVL